MTLTTRQYEIIFTTPDGSLEQSWVTITSTWANDSRSDAEKYHAFEAFLQAKEGQGIRIEAVTQVVASTVEMPWKQAQPKPQRESLPLRALKLVHDAAAMMEKYDEEFLTNARPTIIDIGEYTDFGMLLDDLAEEPNLREHARYG